MRGVEGIHQKRPMFPEVKPQVMGDAEGTDTLAGVGAGGGGAGEEGISAVAANEDGAGNQPGEGGGARPAVIPESEDAGSEASSEGDTQNPESSRAGARKPRPRLSTERVSKRKFQAAYRAAKGNVNHIGAALGYSADAVRFRISKDAELSALHKKEHPEFEPAADAMGRDKEDLQVLANDGVDLVGGITEDDLEKYRTSLKAYGISDKRLEQLKALDGLATDGARLLCVSLRVTHQSYDGQLHKLAEVADDIRARLQGDEVNGVRVALDHQSFAALSKAYVECVKEAGRGYSLVLTGVEAMVRIGAATKGKELGGGKAVAGWGPMKKVRPEESNAND